MSTMDSQQYPDTSYLPSNGYKEYPFSVPFPAHNNPEGSQSGTSYLANSLKPNLLCQGSNQIYYSPLPPPNVSYSHPNFPSNLGTTYSGAECVEDIHRSLPPYHNGILDSTKPDSLSYPLDRNYSYYSTIAGSNSNNYDITNYLQTNVWRYPRHDIMDASQKESLIWRLERDNQNMRKELEEHRKEIDRLRSLVSQGESTRNQNCETSRSHSRYWTPEEHQRFLEAIQKYGHKDVKSIATYVGTRSRTQVRTHAQKYFQRISREFRSSEPSSRIGKRCMSEPNLYGMELESCSSRYGVSVEEESGEESLFSSAQEDDKMKWHGKPPSGIDLLSAVASTWKLPTSHSSN